MGSQKCVLVGDKKSPGKCGGEKIPKTKMAGTKNPQNGPEKLIWGQKIPGIDPKIDLGTKDPRVKPRIYGLV